MSMYEQDEQQSMTDHLKNYMEFIKKARVAYHNGDNEQALKFCIKADEELEKSGMLKGL
ncbi:hypothetical protein Q7A53_05710 [Halobacillus rhizosphaerae]|uniref:hypothetical protein n=1 Tax=Halobacillus rhizosphaerae TaxID=3064889 RepID=UPI00398AADB9